MSAPGPGWYDDGTGTMRWWDGTQWTQARADPGAQGSVTAASQSAPALAGQASSGGGRPRRRGVWIAVGAVAAVVVAAGAVSGFFVLRGLAVPAAGPVPTPSETERAEVAGEVDEADDVLLHPDTWDIAGPPVEPANDAERGAVQAVESYDSAWETADCDAYMRSTTPGWRRALYIEDCDTFAQVAASLEDSHDEISAALITQTGPESYVIGAVYTMPIESGPLAEGATEPPVWRSLASFHVMQRADGWQVSEVHDLDDGREEWEMGPGEKSESDLTLAQWEQAIVHSDCDALFASTTEDFRSGSGLVDCAALQESNQERDAYCQLSTEPVDSYYQTKWDTHHDEIIATMEETCLYLQDEDGNTLDPPEQGDPQEVEFHLIYDWDAGHWLIDNVG